MSLFFLVEFSDALFYNILFFFLVVFADTPPFPEEIREKSCASTTDSTTVYILEPYTY